MNRHDYDTSHEDDYCLWAEIGSWLQGLLIAAGSVFGALLLLVLAAKLGLLDRLLQGLLP